MEFTHDTDRSLGTMSALVNTAVDAGLSTQVELDRFVTEHEVTGSRTHAEEELAQVIEARDQLARFWDLDEDGAVALVNEILLTADALPQLVKHDTWDWHLHATPSEAPLGSRLAVEGAMAMIDVIRAKELGRLRHCAADDCTGVLVDLSRNRSRRYCDLGCGNRANVAAYRARQRATG